MSRKIVLGIVFIALFAVLLSATGQAGVLGDAAAEFSRQLGISSPQESGKKMDEAVGKAKDAAKDTAKDLGDKVEDLPELPATEAEKMLASIPVSDAKQDGYDRKKVFGTWQDPDGNHCDARNDILERDLTGKTYQDHCVILRGTLKDPFSNEVIRFVRGPHSGDVQIDHMVPTRYAWDHGANTWTQEKRIEFANDPLNLTAVKGSLNGSKQDKGPAAWMPPNDAYSCTYMTRFVTVIHEYDLSINSSDAKMLKKELPACR